MSLAASLAHDGREFRTEVFPNSAAAVQHRQHSEDGNLGLDDSENQRGSCAGISPTHSKNTPMADAGSAV